MPRAILHATVVFATLAAFNSGLIAQTDAETQAFPWEGEVTGTNVYVRSGPGTDHYPCDKLHTADRVLVLGEEFGWYRISPPDRSFSYVDTAEVQRVTGSSQGVVIVPRATVRAGSHLVSRKNASQFVLPEGARVDIIGEADGFFKIKPPLGAPLFMTKQYIRQVPERLQTGMVQRYSSKMGTPQPVMKTVQAPLKTTEPAQKPNVVQKPAASVPVTKTEVANEVSKPVDDPFAEMDPLLASTDEADNIVEPDPIVPEPLDPAMTNEVTESQPPAPPVEEPAVAKVLPQTGEHEALLSTVESDLDAEMDKPIAEQDLAPLIARYQEIAEQSEERVESEYAKIRIQQLQNLLDIRQARTKLAEDGENLAAFQTNLQSERMKIMRLRQEKALLKYDFEGELRRSHAFAPEKRRFRLVDRQNETTIAYIDVPRDVMENVDHMIGRTVGIHVSGQHYSPSARVPIAVAASITDLTPRMRGESAIMTPEFSNRRNMPPGIPNSSREAAEREERLAAESGESNQP